MGKSTPSSVPHHVGLGTLEAYCLETLIIPAYVHSRSQSPVSGSGDWGGEADCVVLCVHMSVSSECFLMERKVTKDSWPRDRFSWKDVACGGNRQLTSVSLPPRANLPTQFLTLPNP